MKVLDLLCAHDHAFEGWFASEDDFQGQLTRGLLQCPLCSNLDIRGTSKNPHPAPPRCPNRWTISR